MKKLATVILAMALVFAMALPALAADGDQTGLTDFSSPQTVTQEVKGSYTAPTPTAPDHLYKVEVKWTVKDATYSSTAATYKWNVDTHKYEVDASAGAVTTSDTPGISVLVTNHSNDSLTLALAYADNGSDSVTTSGATGGTTSGTAATAATTSSSQIIGYTDTTSTGAAQTAALNQNITVDNPAAISGANQTLGTFTLTITKGDTALNPTTES